MSSVPLDKNPILLPPTYYSSGPWSWRIVTAALALIIGYILHQSSNRKKRGPLPPGPPGLPIMGQLFSMPQGSMRFRQFEDWHKKYGPLVPFNLGGDKWFLLGGDGSLVRELLDRRGSLYSSRPHKRLAEMLDSGESPIFERNQAKWRTNRKLLVQHFTSISSTQTKENHVPIIEAESTQLLHDLLRSPERFMEHPIRFASSVMTSIVYGLRGPTYDHPAVTGIERIMNEGGDLNSLVPPLDAFPLFMYLPDLLWPWRKQVAKIGSLRSNLYKDLAEKARERVNRGLNPESFANKVYSAKEDLQLTDRRVHMVLAVAHEISGGSDIVANAIMGCLMALANNARVLEKARAELDAVLDEDTLPSWSDWDRLPYIRMVVKETLRWRPPFPWGVLHALEEDDVWNGYTIPKDSTIILNIWNIHMNAERFPKPEDFRPERFESFPLSSSEYINAPDSFSRDHFTFGAGRRSCPGLVIADIDLFLAMSKIIWAFDISTPDGKPLDTSVETAFTGSNLRRPLPFKLNFRVRSEVRARTIEREMKAAEENVFSRFGS